MNPRFVPVLKCVGVLCALLVCARAGAQGLEFGGRVCRWEAGMSAGLNNDGYEFDFAAAYFPVQYVGFRASAGLAGEIERIEDWGEDPWGNPWSDRCHYAVRFKFRPSLILRTPCLLRWESQEAGFYLFAEPGCVLSPGASGSRGARCFCWEGRCGINFSLARYVFTLGYGISDFSLYSGRPDNEQGLPDRYDYITHTVYVGCAYKF